MDRKTGAAYRERTKAKHPRKFTGRRRLREYGLTEKDYQVLLEEQDGRCKICGRAQGEEELRTPLCVDHDHETGKVRGLLCYRCNSGLGALRDSVQLIKKALAYLEGRSE